MSSRVGRTSGTRPSAVKAASTISAAAAIVMNMSAVMRTVNAQP